MPALIVTTLLFITVAMCQDPDVHRDFAQIVTSKGYPCETHNFNTVDGYILTVFRIPYGISGNSPSRPPVLLFHGLLDSSFTWILNMPNESLPYILADNGYDVWLGNARGNRYSNSNINFPPSDSRFWNFTFDDFAKIDVPTTIDYILKASNNFTSIYYIGHSQGTAQMFAALSEDHAQILSSKIRLFIGLGPVTTPSHQTNIYIGYLTDILAELDFAFKFLGINEFLPPLSGVFGIIADLLCLNEPAVCEGVIELICGPHKAAFNSSRMEVMVAHEPGGTSVKNMIHWGQLIKSNLFQKFDYGTQGNLQFYNQTKPPLYNIHNIDPKLPIALFYGLLDELADPTDVQLLISNLPVPPVFTKEISTYSHLDFCWAIDANTVLYQDIISLLKKY